MSARPRLQRAFRAWLAAHGSALAVRCRIVRARRTHIDCSLAGFPPEVVARLGRWGLSIDVEHAGQVWDSLIDIDAFPIRVAGGYACACCDARTRPIYRSREALWCAEVFEPFRRWVDQRLAAARWIALHGQLGDTTWAYLGSHACAPTASTAGLFAVLPVRPVAPA